MGQEDFKDAVLDRHQFKSDRERGNSQAYNSIKTQERWYTGCHMDGEVSKILK